MLAILVWGLIAAAVLYYSIIFYAERNRKVHYHEEGEECNERCCSPSEFRKRQAEPVVLTPLDPDAFGDDLSAVYNVGVSQPKDYVEEK